MTSRNRLSLSAIALIVLGMAGLAAAGYFGRSRADRVGFSPGWGWMSLGGGPADGKIVREGMKRMMAGRLPPGVDPGTLPDAGSRGAGPTSRVCGQCHDVPSPAFHTAEEWPRVAGRMFDRLERMGRMPMMRGALVPAPKVRQDVVAYLQAHALDPLARDLPEAGSEDAELFRAACFRCHALPDPAIRTALMWPAVVDRMRGRMREMTVREISGRERDAIAAYLSRHAGKPRSGPAQAASPGGG